LRWRTLSGVYADTPIIAAATTDFRAVQETREQRTHYEARSYIGIARGKDTARGAALCSFHR
jgi:hypothetical protein